MLRGKATLPLWFEPSHDYVGSAVTEIIYGPLVLIRAGFSAVGIFLGRKLKISIEDTPKEFQFYIGMPNFRLLGSIIKKVPEGSRSPKGRSRRCNFVPWNKGHCPPGTLLHSASGVASASNNVGLRELGAHRQLPSRWRRGKVWEQNSTEQSCIVWIDF